MSTSIDASTRISVPFPDTQEVTPAPSTLVPCPDCSHKCSRYAEACPQCGRFFQRFDKSAVEVYPGEGWIGKIAWGIVVSSFLWGLIIAAMFLLGVVLLIGLAGLGAASAPPRPGQEPSRILPNR